MFDTPNWAPIQSKDVGVGTLIWYKGRIPSSGTEWNCPAVICHVSSKRGFFRVMSLDDMKEQEQEYRIEPTEHIPSRRNMRLASVAEVDAYLALRKGKRSAARIIAKVQADARRKKRVKKSANPYRADRQFERQFSPNFRV